MNKHITALLIALWATSRAFAISDTATTSAPQAAKPVSLTKADKLFESQRYAAALDAYYKAWQANPGNPNINFKLGLTYHYLLQNPDLCIKLFAAAAQNNSATYNFYSGKQVQSSQDALYYLGKSYLHKSLPDTAIVLLAQYQNKLRDNIPLDAGRQLVMCVNYNQLSNQPRQLKITPVGGEINTEFNEGNPVLSLDGKVLFFSTRRPGMGEQDNSLFGDNDIYVSYQNEQGKFSPPMPFDNNTALDEEPLYVNFDGNKLYFRQQSKSGTGDIFFTERLETTWGKAQKLKGVNSAADENGIAFSADGNYMVVSSNRPGGFGGYDLYISKKKGSSWGGLVNMGEKINTEMDETYPYMHPTENRLYFSSNGNTQYGMGGFDILFTQRDSANTWSEPFTLGFPLNTGGNELAYYVSAEGKSYYTAINEQGNFDLYEIKAGEYERKLEEKITNIVGTETVTEVQVVEVEKEKKVEVAKEVEVSKIQEVETEVEKEVGFVSHEEARKLDKVLEVREKEVLVETQIFVPVANQEEADKLNAEEEKKAADLAAERAALDANSNTPSGTKKKEDESRPAVSGPVAITDDMLSENNSTSNTSANNNPIQFETVATPSYPDSKPTESDDIAPRKVNTTTGSGNNTTTASNTPSTNKTTQPESTTPETEKLRPEPTNTKPFKTVAPLPAEDKRLIRPKVHLVREGENINALAAVYDISVHDIKKWNKLNGNDLNPGVPVIVGYEYNSEVKELLAMEQLKLAGIDPGDREAIIANIKQYYEDKVNQQNTAVFKNLYFDFNSDNPDISKTEMEILVAFLKEHKNVNIEAVGHTDNIGAWETNFWVSRERARKVYSYLVAQGISTSRIIFNGKGSTEPIASNYTQDGRAKNRRVEIKLIK